METLDILLLAFEFPPYPLAGTGLYALNLVKSLKKHNVTVLTPNHSGKDSSEQIENATIKRISLSSFTLINKFSGQAKVNRSFIDKKTLFSLKAKRYIREQVALGEYDLFHSLNERDGAFLDYAMMNKNLPTIVSVNDYYILGSSLNPLAFEFKSTDLPLRYVHHNIMKQVYKKELRACTRIIPNCNFVSKIIQKACAVSQEKITVIHRGIDTKKFDILPEKNKYTSKKVLFIGPNAERKGALFLVQAVPAILKEHPESHFTLIGSCSAIYRRKLFSFIEKHNLSSSMTYIEHLPQDQLLKYYREANIFVMPSIMEAMGQVYLEAMSSRTPVIGADVGGVGEIITPDVGYLVPPRSPEVIAETINLLLSDPLLAERLGKRGNERALGYFSIERQMKETMDVYKSLLR